MTKQNDAATIAVRAAIESDTQHGAVIPPLYLSSNFAFAGFGEKRKYDYTRSGNPTRDALADALTELEGGAGATITSSGMAALTLTCQLLQPGDLLIALHARKSFAAIRRWSVEAPEKPLVVALTGTDLYRDLGRSEEVLDALHAARRDDRKRWRGGPPRRRSSPSG